MKQNEIQIDKLYVAKVNGKLTKVKVNTIRVHAKTAYSQSRTIYDVTNIKTGRSTSFRSASKFRALARGESPDVR
jgi:hypothetical protein